MRSGRPRGMSRAVQNDHCNEPRTPRKHAERKACRSVRLPTHLCAEPACVCVCVLIARPWCNLNAYMQHKVCTCGLRAAMTPGNWQSLPPCGWNYRSTCLVCHVPCIAALASCVSNQVLVPPHNRSSHTQLSTNGPRTPMCGALQCWPCTAMQQSSSLRARTPQHGNPTATRFAGARTTHSCRPLEALLHSGHR
jgi:hypothetical protein